MDFGNVSYLSLLGFILISQMMLTSANFILNLLRSEAILKTKERTFYRYVSECLASKSTHKWVKISNAIVSLSLTIWQITLNALVFQFPITELDWCDCYSIIHLTDDWWKSQKMKMNSRPRESCLHFVKNYLKFLQRLELQRNIFKI